MNKIAIYPGSFLPFHRGHYNILLKAEKIFDKVIIARGLNPEKKGIVNEWVMRPCKTLQDRETLTYTHLLTDFVKTLQYKYDNITIIRGLRNSVDLQYEMNQYRFLQDLMPEIQVIAIFCDKEYEHISSSAIRMLQGYGDDKVKDYLIE